MTYYKLDIKTTDLKELEPKPANANGKKFAVILDGGTIDVLDGVCSHEGGPLGDGYIDNRELICPWHSGAFDISTGKADENTPWATDVKRYEAKIDQATGEIEVEF
jgi:nitrite reductase/ring-hydroxylating ferredoxin subunit